MGRYDYQHKQDLTHKGGEVELPTQAGLHTKVDFTHKDGEVGLPTQAGPHTQRRGGRTTHTSRTSHTKVGLSRRKLYQRGGGTSYQQKQNCTNKGGEAGPVPEVDEEDGDAESDEEEDDGHEEDVGNVDVVALPQPAQHVGARLLRGVGVGEAVDDGRANRCGGHARCQSRRRCRGGALRDVGRAVAAGEVHLQTTTQGQNQGGPGQCG